jgi:hypothetical protein
MSGSNANPKSDLIGQASERRTVFAQLSLRQRSEDHPMVMFGSIVAAAFIWTLLPGETSVSAASATSAPRTEIHDTITTQKTSRLPMPDVEQACEGQSWGGESLACVTMIAKVSGKSDVKVRMIADAAPAHLDTPNIF